MTAAPFLDGGSGSAEQLLHWSLAALPSDLDGARAEPGGVLPYLEQGATAFYWELHFERAELVRTDFLQRVALGVSNAPRRSAVDPIVEALDEFYSDPETSSHCHAAVWLELDGPLRGVEGARRQGVSICLDPAFGTSAPRLVVQSTASAVALFSRLQRVCGVPQRGATTLGRLSDKVSSNGGTIRHLSLMRGREGAPGKCYAALPKERFPAFLREVAWPGDLAAALRLAEVACATSERVNCDLEFGTDLGVRLGFELFNDPSPGSDPFRRCATEPARRLGLLSERQTDALESWVGMFRKQLRNDVWPTRIQRWFDLKFVMHAENRPELKAYLGWRPISGIF